MEREQQKGGGDAGSVGSAPVTAVFETMRVRDSVIPLLERHLERFEFNWRAEGLAPPDLDLREDIERKVGERGGDHVIRFEWDGSELTLTTRDLPSLDPITIITASIMHPGYVIKTTNREAFDRARQEARRAGAEAGLLLTSEGYVGEGSLFAIAWFAGDALCMPSLDLAILPSIGRQRTIEVAESLDIEVREGAYRREELDGKATFITTSVRGVVPIRTLDGVAVPTDGRVERLAELFWPAVDPPEGAH